MFRTVSLSIIRSLILYTQQQLFVIQVYLLLCIQYKAPDDGQKTCPKHVEFYSKNKFEKLVHLIGFIIRMYHDVRSSECQKPTEPSLLTPNQQVSQIRMLVEVRRMRNLLPLCMEGIRQMFGCRTRCNPNLPLQPPTQTTIWAYSEFARGLSLPYRSSVYRDRARLRPGISQIFMTISQTTTFIRFHIQCITRREGPCTDFGGS